MHAHRDYWQAARVGCYWTNPRYPHAVVNTTSRPMPDGTRFSGYVAAANFVELGLFATRGLAQQAVEAVAERA